MITPYLFFFALLGGIFPALIWLWFWLHEDRKHPEPKKFIALAFFAGMLAVPFILPLEKITWDIVCGSMQGVGQKLSCASLQDVNLMYALSPFSIIVLFSIWAFFEEIFKFGASYLAVLRKKETDEPVDAVIYLITTALGFAALENTLFIMQLLQGPLPEGISNSIITGNLRFIGATLLHTVASATIGIFMALSFYKKKHDKRVSLFWGISSAGILHTAFNFFIMKDDGIHVLTVFVFVWVAIIALMLFLERIKKIRTYKVIN
ncbi:MAG: PrsW family glutamic-type intramembrane protease [Patescibacteria group bacterium]